ncbi:unnamed protein product, partial [marine sediment metagenome]
MKEYTVLVSLVPTDSSHQKSKRRSLAVHKSAEEAHTSWSADERLNELEQLAKTAGAKVATKLSVKQKRIDPSFYIGRGKVEQIAKLAYRIDSNL